MDWMSESGHLSGSDSDSDSDANPVSFLGDPVLVGEGLLDVSPYVLCSCLSESGFEMMFTILV